VERVFNSRVATTALSVDMHAPRKSCAVVVQPTVSASRTTANEKLHASELGVPKPCAAPIVAAAGSDGTARPYVSGSVGGGGATGLAATSVSPA
jgi:hypothetical protein